MGKDLLYRFGFVSFICVLALIGIFVTFVISDDSMTRFAVSAVSAFMIYFSIRLAMFSGVTDNKVRVAVVSANSFVAYICLQFNRSISDFAGSIYSIVAASTNLRFIASVDINGHGYEYASYIFSGIVLLFMAFVSEAVLRSLQINSPMGRPNVDIDDVLPRTVNPRRLEILKQGLRDSLDQIDSATRWSDANYVPLQAEVQVVDGKNVRRKIVDLQNALKKEVGARLFVILGEPGSGKSVALRKLARDLLSERVHLKRKRARIPLYINLKEWRVDQSWTPENPPIVKDFHDFVWSTITKTLDFNSISFLQDQDTYARLHEAGFFFFILDSFDEIPAVLDHDENSWLITSLSNAIANYITSGNARGVIASRLFRKPNLSNSARTLLEIRPFSDEKIVSAVDLMANNPEMLKRAILSERPDLGHIARNPFLLHLVVSYFNQNGTPPLSQAQVFEAHVKKNIHIARTSFSFLSMDDKEIFEICEKISHAMFQVKNVGLEIPEHDLAIAVPDPRLSEVIRFLTQARIGRVGTQTGTFSFAHRRFNEYFLVRRLASGQIEIPFDAIQTDSRWRDALVLYAEIAPQDVSTRLAEHAWGYASRLATLSLTENRREFIESRNALRFLVEAYRNRPDKLSSMHGGICDIINDKLNDDADLIEKKTVLEAIGLLPVEMAYGFIVRCLLTSPGWVSESAAAAARYFARVDNIMSLVIFRECVERPGFQGVREAKRQARVLALSEGFRDVALWLNRYFYDVVKGFSLSVFLIVSSVFSYFFEMEAPLTATILALSAAGYYYLAFLLARLSVDLAALIFGRNKIRLNALWKRVIPNVFAEIPGVGANDLKDVTLKQAVMWPPLLNKPTSFPPIFFAAYAISSAYFASGGSLTTVWGHMVKINSNFGMNVTVAMAILSVCGIVPLRGSFWTKWRVMTAMMVGSLSLAIIFTILKYLFLFSAAVAAYILLILYSARIADRYAIFIGICTALIVLGMALYVFVRAMKEYILLKKLTKNFVPDREIIGRDFMSFRTSYARSIYVEWVDRKSVDYLDILRQPENSWEGSSRPQIRSDAASVRLAQVEARWLGLD